MDTASTVRNYLFGTLLPMPKEKWPDDEEDLFNLGLDSVRIMRLLVFLETELRTMIPDEAITPERLSSIRRIAELVDSARSASQ
jgi:acyl carrier protein